MITGVVGYKEFTGDKDTLSMVELYARGAVPDLSVYSLRWTEEGKNPTSNGLRVSLSGSLAARDYYWVNMHKSSQKDGMNQFFGQSASQTAIENVKVGESWVDLFKSGTLVDTYGERWNKDDWIYKEGWALSSSSRVPSDTFNPGEWEIQEGVWSGQTNPTDSTRFDIATLDPCKGVICCCQCSPGFVPLCALVLGAAVAKTSSQNDRFLAVVGPPGNVCSDNSIRENCKKGR